MSLVVLTALAIGSIGSACLLGTSAVGPKKVFAAAPVAHTGTLGVGARTVGPVLGSVTAAGKIHIDRSADATAVAALSLPVMKRVATVPVHRKVVRTVVRTVTRTASHRAAPRIATARAQRTSYSGVRGIIASVARSKGLDGRNITALLTLCRRESGFNPRARNHSYLGLFQLNRGMVDGGPWQDAAWNTARAIRYIQGRYGSPVSALAHSYSRGWY